MYIYLYTHIFIYVYIFFFGRPGQTTTAFKKQPDEEVSSSSGESSTDSTSELLKIIDLNADNAENDTLVDASALNETADINTEINEPIIQMVVPASIVGYAIRGGRGSRGGRGREAGVLTESETSTLRRSKRNAQNSS